MSEQQPSSGGQTFPGLNRLSYLFWQLGAGVVFAIALLFQFWGSEESEPNLWIIVAACVGYYVVTIYAMVRRYHNQLASGWWVAGSFVPLLNLYVGIRALAYPPGYNTSRKFDGPAKAVVGVFAVLFGGAAIAGAVDSLTRSESPATPVAQETTDVATPTPVPTPIAATEPAIESVREVEEAISCDDEIAQVMADTKVSYAHCESPQLYELQACAEPDRFSAVPVDRFDAITVLDGSGSMAGWVGGITKMRAAVEAIDEVVELAAPTADLGLMVYGHKGDNSDSGKAASCVAGELVAPVGSSANEIRSASRALRPTGWTPIAETLDALRARVLANPDRAVRVTVISDGLETCGGDPVAAAEALKAAGADVSINVIGFEVGNAEVAQLRNIAKAGGGVFFDAKGRLGLRDAALAEAKTRNAQMAHELCSAAAAARTSVYSQAAVAKYSVCLSLASNEEWSAANAVAHDWLVERGALKACYRPLREKAQARYEAVKAHSKSTKEAMDQTLRDLGAI